MDVIVIETPQLGDRSYLVHDGAVALVIDPQRDTDRVEQAAADAGVRITHVAETHLHNDYLTGGYVLARDHGAAYLVNAADPVRFDRTPVSDGAGQAVFSGGSLLYGSVGRTDLLGSQDTLGLTRDQYASTRRLAAEAGRDAVLYPTHGFGSFCSSGPAAGTASSTIGEQLRSNHALTDPDEEHFVRQLIANLTAYPSYYAHMTPANPSGPGPASLAVPESLDPAELGRRLAAGEWVVDLRNRVAFASSHLQGAASFEYGTGSSFTTYLGWVLPWDRQLTLVGTHEDVGNAIRDLSRIGIDNPDAAVGTDPAALAPDSPTASYPRAGWARMLRERRDGDTIVDVRRTDEYASAHIQGAVNIPLHELLTRLDEVPAGRLWVHCASGYRSRIGASLLQRAGREVVHLDAGFDDAEASGVGLSRG
jgi:hydroxyacylglutathione hydrolase